MLDQITPIVISFNEEPNIGRCLEKLRWASRILVVDSFSTDETLSICSDFANVDLVQREFINFADQCNYAIQDSRISTEWVLSLDADYMLSYDILAEIAALRPNALDCAYESAFTYVVDGKTLRGSLYPPRVTLFRKNEAHYLQDGHAHRVMVNGKVSRLTAKIFHDDRKSRARWTRSQKVYCRQEALKLRNTTFSELSFADKVRRIPGLSLVLLPFYLAIAKGLVLDGRAGCRYMQQRLYAEALLQRELIKRTPVSQD